MTLTLARGTCGLQPTLGPSSRISSRFFLSLHGSWFKLFLLSWKAFYCTLYSWQALRPFWRKQSQAKLFPRKTFVVCSIQQKPTLLPGRQQVARVKAEIPPLQRGLSGTPPSRDARYSGCQQTQPIRPSPSEERCLQDSDYPSNSEACCSSEFSKGPRVTGQQLRWSPVLFLDPTPPCNVISPPSGPFPCNLWEP